MSDMLSALKEIGANTDEGLYHFMDDKEDYLKYIKQFPEENSMKKLIEAVNKKDYAAAEKAVHSLKGIVSTLEFVPLTDASIDMLSELREGNITDALDAFEDVKEQYQQFCDVINKYSDS